MSIESLNAFSMNFFSLKGKTAIVTGGNSGLGQAFAMALAKAGANLFIPSFVKDNGETKEIIEKQGVEVEFMQVDITEKGAPQKIIAACCERFGTVDILVNNAGTIRREDALSFSEKDWDEVMNLNLKSVFFLAQAVARQFLAQDSGGKIINIASMLSFQGGIRVPSYTASKSGVLGITRLLANEWAQHRINVNAIAPGYMATNNTQQLRDDADRSKAILDRIPAARWGTPEDLKGPVVFLASAAADYISGYTVAVDGGWLAR